MVDVRDTCANTMVYIADLFEFAVIVYDYEQNVAWKTENQNYYPNEENSTFTIEGVSFNETAGVFGMALSRQRQNSNSFSTPCSRSL